MIDLKFIFIAYSFGPILAVPHALTYISLTTVEIFFYLTVLYIIPLPLIFKFFEFNEKKIYKLTIIEKICKVCKINTKEEVEKVKKTGDDFIEYFERKLGHLGFYIAISLFTFLFGIFWAAFLSYLLKVKRTFALLSISLGVIFGNLFWILIIFYSLPMINTEIIILLFVFFLLIYGRKRELDIIKKIGKEFLK